MAINPRPSNIDRSLLQAPNDTFSALEDDLVEQELEIITEEETEDGGAEVVFGEDDQPLGEEPDNFYDNLAEFLSEDTLSKISSYVSESVEDDKTSRDEWVETYTKGLELLGLKYESRTEPFDGATGVIHPILNEAVTQFQAGAYKEMLPPAGPVNCRILGESTKEVEEQAKRVKDYMNYEIMEKMKEYEPEFDQMLFNLPLAGSAFKKVYYDFNLGRCVSKFVPAEDLVVPYSATSLEDAEAIIHVVKMSGNDLRKQQIAGFYKDVDIGEPAFDTSEVKEKKDRIEGVSRSVSAEMHTLLECHVELDLEGYEDRNVETGEETGIKLPYIVTVHDETGNVLSIRRNYGAQDPLKKKKEYFVHFKFLPGLGFYGFGLIHMIGGLSRTATAALRQLLDAGTLSNLPAGFKQRGIRVRDEAQPLQPGEFRDVDAPGGNLRDAFMPLPFKEPSGTLLQLMGVVVQAGQRFASIADMQVGDGNQGAAVGTTVALLERGSRVMSAIHKRLYAAMKCEFMLLADNFATFLPKMYPYDIVGGQRQVFAADFDNRIDIIPVADPNIFSQTQRITIAQTELQLATSNPQIHNLYFAYRQMYEALGIKNIDAILPPPAPMQPMDPALEHINALGMKPFQAFRGQDHRAHVTAHLNFMSTNMVRNNPAIMAAIQKNILEHISLMAQEQIELEFREELPRIAMMMQQAQMNPNMQREAMALQQRVDSRKAVLISEMMEDYMKEENKITSRFGNDPIAMLRARELDLQAQENARKQQEGEERINLDRMRAMMNKDTQEEKLDQNERLANLRADTSIEKTILQNELKKE